MEGQQSFIFIKYHEKIFLLHLILVHLSRKVHILAATRRLQDGHDGCENYNIKGKQELVYSNNSSDTLKKVYICLIMHSSRKRDGCRLHSIKDPDGRMVNKVSKRR
jgi:hypothetical protein